MLAVEGVVGPSPSSAIGFPTPATLAMATVAATAPTVVAGTPPGVSLLPLMSVAKAVEPTDPRPLLMPVVPTQIGGSNTPAPVGSNAGSTTTSTTNTTNNNNNNNNSTMEQTTEELVKPVLKDGEILLEVECGQNKANMYLSKLCQGSKGPCIYFQESWLTPNEFQFVSGRETAKDWKRSIRHHGKSLKLLLAKGILNVHPTMCDCQGCRIGAVLTRKGEKRRIPNGERKRKSTSNTPENSGNGAFRAVGNLAGVKNPDGPTEPKRSLLDKPAEGNQSPLKESSMLNLPAEVKEGSSGRQVDPHLQDVAKLPLDSRVTSPAAPLPLPSSDLKSGDSSQSGFESALPQDLEDSSAAVTPRHQQQSAVSAPPVSLSPDVQVLSSLSVGAAAISSIDKSLSRLALYHAASASLKGSGAVSACLPELSSCVAIPKSDKPLSQHPHISSNHERDTDGSSNSSTKDYAGQSVSDDQSCEAHSPPPQQEVNNSSMDSEASAQEDIVVSESEPTESKDLKPEDSSQTAISHSIASHVKVCEPNNNSSSSISVSVSAPLSFTAPAAALTSPVIAAAAPAVSNIMPHISEAEPQKLNKDNNTKHKETSPSSLPSSSLLSPHSHHSEKEGHITIRHPSPERPAKVVEPAVKHSPVKPSKEHKDRKVEHGSNSGEHRDRHSSRDGKETVTTSRPSHDRDPDRRRPEERADRDRKAGSTSTGQSSKVDDGSSSSRGPEAVVSGRGGRVEGIPTSVSVVPAVPVPTPMADPAGFSEYMRALAATHNGFVPQSVSCLPPGMFQLRQADPSLGSTAMMHPMQAVAACGMFSSPAALLPKEPVMYQAAPAGTLPPVSYGYGAPGMPHLSLLPQQYSTASMLDYARPFPYMHWPAGLPLMMPDAMNAAAGSKRSREEMEVAMEKQRLQMPVSPYGMAHVNPMEYMAAYRGLATPMPNGIEAAFYDKNAAEFLRKRMYGELSASVGSMASKSMVDSPYLASLPEYYKSLLYCPCMKNHPGDIRTWPVEDVAKLVSSLEGCAAYSEIFREQRVDGKILVLLTPDSLMQNQGLKMGPAITLTTHVAKLLLDATRSSGCSSCQQLASMAPVVKSAIIYTT
ncbi:hypothetical protein ACOMHN_031558 [Nucella lapillus]